jgi:hypothetical protein
MSGDYSRRRFDPFNDFAGVLMQQGRVQLDGDWNELVDIVDRRLRAETTDIIGRATVPTETPDGFKVAIAAGVPTIGRGRIYVDGLLAENHGAPPLQLDSVLAEQHGTNPVAYNDQPYFPSVATVAPFPTAGGPHLVYVDVWDREVTYLEAPSLVEVALGVDTTTRTQTVWQVRVLPNVGAGASCDTPDNGLNGWPAVLAPSAGRLTTAAVGVAAEDDPCLTPPSGGFRGLENRLYRVEIHDGGPQGSATFKWSRDNASVAKAVTAMPDLSNLVVVRTGRDAELRFSAGDWLEITDDWRELAGQAGIIAQVQEVNDGTRTITLASALPAGVFPTDSRGLTDPSRHTRIRRWDQRGQVSDTNGNLIVDLHLPGSAGVIPVPPSGTSIVLEYGVQITFHTSPAGGAYHVGDYWVFAARTADASVEVLSEAPPRGVHHHYARLAIVTLPDDLTDCRTLWPPHFGDTGCDCTVCVSPHDGPNAIQAAIDQIKAVGGTICLGAGVYNLRQPVRIVGGQSLKIKGQGWKTQLIYLGPGAAIASENSIGIELEEMTIVTSGALAVGGIAVGARNVVGLTVQRCVLAQLGAGETSLPAIGLTGVIAGSFLRENGIVAASGIGSIPEQGAAGTVEGGPPILMTVGLSVQDNFLLCRQRGVDFEGTVIHAGPTGIAGNLALGCSAGGIIALGLTPPVGGLQIVENRLETDGDAITVGSDGTNVSGNHIAGAARSTANGIVLRSLRETGIDRCQVVNNEIVSVGGVGIAVQSRVRSALVKQNSIEGAGAGGIIMGEKSSADIINIENNHVVQTAPTANDRNVPITGIRTWNTAHAVVAGNVVIGVGPVALQSPERAGIQAIGPSRSMRISGNDVADVGPPGEFVRETAGIEYLGGFGQLEVSENRVRRGRGPLPASSPSAWFALRIQAALVNQSIAGTNFTFLATDVLAFAILGAKVIRLRGGDSQLTVQGNQLESFGQSETVRIATRASCIFSNNQCVLDLRTDQPAAAVGAGALVASGNYLQAPGDLALVITVPEPGAFTVLGNVTRGQIRVNGAPLAPPWLQLNVAT